MLILVCLGWKFQEALADEARMKAKYENDTEIAKAKRDYELKKAAYDIEVQTKVRISDHVTCLLYKEGNCN